MDDKGLRKGTPPNNAERIARMMGAAQAIAA